MSTNSLRLKPQIMSPLGTLVRAAIFLTIILVSVLVGALNYLAGNVVFFVVSFPLIFFGFKSAQGRNLLLLVYFHLLALISVINIAVVAPPLRRFVTTNFPTINADLGVILSSIVIGLTATFFAVTIPFFLFMALVTIYVLNWHRGEGVSFFEAFTHIVRTVLGIGSFSVVIEGQEMRGDEGDIRRLKIFGGPGWLIIYPGQVVVLHKHGKMTRAVGAGSVFLKREEKVKAILPLDTNGGIQEVEGVLTRDRIPLQMKILHVVQLEPASETRARLEQVVTEAESNLESIKADQNVSAEDKEAAGQAVKEAKKQLNALENDQIIGDDFDQCYESVAKTAATRVPKIWDALKNPIANNMKDVIMSVYSEELFTIGGDVDKLEAKINERKIAEIEKIVFNKSKGAKVKGGVVLRLIDINQVKFPEELQAKINEEVETQIDERIHQTKVRIEESKAKSTLIGARAKAQAKTLAGRSEGEARAAEFRELLRELKREKSLKDDEVAQAVLKLISTTTTLKELENLYKITLGSRERSPISSPEDANGSHAS